MTLKTDVHAIDHVMDELGDPAESQCELLREHLESARQYLQGSMEREYKLGLQLANQAINCISDHERRKRVQKMIDDMLAAES
jgi:hypothetical protein